jgi:hypothetical protein
LLPTAISRVIGGIVLKSCRAVVLAAALLPMSGGVAAAEPLPLAYVEQSKATMEGWKLTVSLKEATINSVPNMAATAIVREGFITATAKLAVEDTADMADKGVITILTLFAQLGCQVNVENGAALSFNPEITSSLPRLDLTPTPDEIAIAPTLQLSPQLSVTLAPGEIMGKSLGEMAYPPKEEQFKNDSKAIDGLMVSIKDVHMTVNKCGGPVSIRLSVQGTMKTAKSFDTVQAYSDILSL